MKKMYSRGMNEIGSDHKRSDIDLQQEVRVKVLRDSYKEKSMLSTGFNVQVNYLGKYKAGKRQEAMSMRRFMRLMVYVT